MSSSRFPPAGGLAFPPLSRSALLLIVINAALWLSLLVLAYLDASRFAWVLSLFALDPDAVLSGYVFQIVTYMFIHDWRSPMHLLLNMLLVYFFAGPLEQRWGRTRVLLFALGAGVAGGAMVMLFALLGGLLGFSGGALTFGFSGAALGMLAAFCILYAEASILLFFVIPVKAKYLLWLTVGIDLLFWIAPGSDVSFPAHLGGMLFGVLVAGGGALLWRRITRRLRYRRIVKEALQVQPKDKVVKGPWVH
ncbi:MAG: rhomboid family intramembrane serine protease [Myxococcota bacterium]|jgi:membrane associated rhomboid family serine protease|nr:rhomboid family intramembrane serine protease [Myxococcota bacterium]